MHNTSPVLSVWVFVPLAFLFFEVKILMKDTILNKMGLAILF